MPHDPRNKLRFRAREIRLTDIETHDEQLRHASKRRRAGRRRQRAAAIAWAILLAVLVTALIVLPLLQRGQ